MSENPIHPTPENNSSNDLGLDTVHIPRNPNGIDSFGVGKARHDVFRALDQPEYIKVISPEMEMRNLIAQVGLALAAARKQELEETFFLDATYKMPAKSDYDLAA